MAKAAYGLYLTIDEDMLEMLDALHASDDDKKVDICIKHGDVAKEFSLDQFLTLLGFDPPVARSGRG